MIKYGSMLTHLPPASGRTWVEICFTPGLCPSVVSVAAHHLLCATIACGLQYVASDARPSSFLHLSTLPSLPLSQPPGPASEPAG